MDAQRINLGNLNIEKVNNGNRPHPPNLTPQPGKSFGDALNRAHAAGRSEPDVSGIKFSKHATARLNSREVDLSPEQLKRVETGVAQAKTKGVSDSLVLVDDYALVVNTRSMTVVTAMQNGHNGGVFTNINGAVLV